MLALILRFDAPLMSFGGVMVDQHGPTDRFPGLSLLAGLCGNALGLRHSDGVALDALQSRLEYAARWDVPPTLLVDYHTVDLSQDKMREPGWTTRGQPEHRAGGSARVGTHERMRHYWANGVMTIALTVVQEEKPSVRDLARAFQTPARPLFIGRKSCLPASAILVGTMEANDVLDALRRTPTVHRPGAATQSKLEACWPTRLGSQGVGHEVIVFDRRDWLNQTVAGRHTRYEGYIEVGEEAKWLTHST